MGKTSVREEKSGWLASLLGAVVLIAGGFGLGLVAGLVSEEPELVVGHLVGRSDEATWLPAAEVESTPARGDWVHAAAAAKPELAEPEPRSSMPSAELALPAVAAAPSARREDRAPREITSIPTQAPPPSIRSGFSVQVGAFAEGGTAERVREKLRSKGFETYVTTAKQSGDGKWRVRVGPVTEKGDAERLASRLKIEERLPTWVVVEGGG